MGAIYGSSSEFRVLVRNTYWSTCTGVLEYVKEEIMDNGQWRHWTVHDSTTVLQYHVAFNTTVEFNYNILAFS